MKTITWDYNGTRFKGGIVRLVDGGHLPRRRRPVKEISSYLTGTKERYHCIVSVYSNGHEIRDPRFPHQRDVAGYTAEEFAADFRQATADGITWGSFVLTLARPDQLGALRKEDLLPLLGSQFARDRLRAIQALAHVEQEEPQPVLEARDR